MEERELKSNEKILEGQTKSILSPKNNFKAEIENSNPIESRNQYTLKGYQQQNDQPRFQSSQFETNQITETRKGSNPNNPYLKQSIYNDQYKPYIKPYNEQDYRKPLENREQPHVKTEARGDEKYFEQMRSPYGNLVNERKDILGSRTPIDPRGNLSSYTPQSRQELSGYKYQQSDIKRDYKLPEYKRMYPDPEQKLPQRQMSGIEIPAKSYYQEEQQVRKQENIEVERRKQENDTYLERQQQGEARLHPQSKSQEFSNRQGKQEYQERGLEQAGLDKRIIDRKDIGEQKGQFERRGPDPREYDNRQADVRARMERQFDGGRNERYYSSNAMFDQGRAQQIGQLKQDRFEENYQQRRETDYRGGYEREGRLQSGQPLANRSGYGPIEDNRLDDRRVQIEGRQGLNVEREPPFQMRPGFPERPGFQERPGFEDRPVFYARPDWQGRTPYEGKQHDRVEGKSGMIERPEFERRQGFDGRNTSFMQDYQQRQMMQRNLDCRQQGIEGAQRAIRGDKQEMEERYQDERKNDYRQRFERGTDFEGNYRQKVNQQIGDQDRSYAERPGIQQLDRRGLVNEKQQYFEERGAYLGDRQQNFGRRPFDDRFGVEGRQGFDRRVIQERQGLGDERFDQDRQQQERKTAIQRFEGQAKFDEHTTYGRNQDFEPQRQTTENCRSPNIGFERRNQQIENRSEFIKGTQIETRVHQRVQDGFPGRPPYEGQAFVGRAQFEERQPERINPISRQDLLDPRQRNILEIRNDDRNQYQRVNEDFGQLNDRLVNYEKRRETDVKFRPETSFGRGEYKERQYKREEYKPVVRHSYHNESSVVDRLGLERGVAPNIIGNRAAEHLLQGTRLDKQIERDRSFNRLGMGERAVNSSNKIGYQRTAVQDRDEYQGYVRSKQSIRTPLNDKKDKASVPYY